MTTREDQQLRSALRERFPRERAHLLPALHYLQEEFGYLPGWAMEVVGWHLRVPASEIYGVATSYTEFRIEQPGHHVLRVCAGLGCWTNGGKELLEGLRDGLGVSPGSTTPDGQITLEETACGFLCGVSPVMEWDGAWHGRVSLRDAMQLMSRG